MWSLHREKWTFLRQYMQEYVIITVCIIAISAGFCSGWINATLPKLLSKTPPFLATKSQINLLINFPIAVALLCAPLAILIVQKAGRKVSLQTAAVLFGFSWMLISQSSSFVCVFLGRTLSGGALSFFFVAAITYLVEICQDKIRATAISLFSACQSLGLVFTYCFGAYFSMTTLAYICLCFPLIACVLLIWIPESPYFYLIRGNEKKGQINFRQIRPPDYNVEEEFLELQESVRKRQEERVHLTEIIQNKAYRKGFFLVCLLLVAQQFSGAHIFFQYNQIIFFKAQVDISPNVTSLVIGIVHFAVQLLATRACDKFGRKPIIMLSMALTTLALCLIGILYFLREIFDVQAAGFNWWFLTTMAFYNIAIFGLIIVPPIYISELFSSKIRTAAIAIFYLITGVMTLISSELFIVLAAKVHMCSLMWMHATVALVAGFLCGFFLPETKGKTIEEIQEMLAH